MNASRLKRYDENRYMIIGRVGWVLFFSFLVFMATPAMAEDVYLYVFFHDGNSQGERFRTKIPEPVKASGDYEVTSAMWCGSEDFQRNYNGTW